jgi:ABC-type multidrug transport system fused ATPase/permease subunit
LILDEATSALDNESERLVQDALQKLMQGRTTLIVAHRLSTLRLADRLLVLDGGRLIETGNHAQLMKLDGRYASLYKAHQVLEIESIAS